MSEMEKSVQTILLKTAAELVKILAVNLKQLKTDTPL
jgi:hypothetical protein